MDFRESDEQIMLRQSAAAIATGYGHDWFVRKARADERSDELWTALAKKKPKAKTAATGEDAAAEVEGFTPSAALTESLTTHRTAAISATLAGNPDVEPRVPRPSLFVPELK